LKQIRNSILILLFLLSCSKKEISYTLSGKTMGTRYKIDIISTVFDSSGVHNSIKNLLTNINKEMSTYIDSSTISKFNSLNARSSIKINSDFEYVLNKSKYYNEITNGSFDVTIKPLVELWGFGSSKSILSIPESNNIDSAITLLGIEKVYTDKNRRLFKSQRVNIDFSAIAKGYAVDKISDFLKTNSLINHMVEIGGEIKVSGKNKNRGNWNIGIQNPSLQNSSPLIILAISDKGVATSGNYRNYYDINGKRYSHIISPLTGFPVENKIKGVTVISNTCIDSDALATALMVMDLNDGMKLVEELKEVEAFYIL